MTTSGICELFGFAQRRRRKNGGAGITSGWKMACALLVLCVACAIESPAQTFRILNNLNTSGPSSPLVQGLDGNFYRTTRSGGASNQGAVFKMTPSGLMTTFHSFDGTDGAIPVGLIQATDGNFYGATYSGGNQNPACYPFFDQRCGTAFRITPSGAFTTLHSFNGTDGANPESRLIQATDGNFYGTTSMGGAYYRGTVFKITPEGTLTTLYSFDGTDGAYPVGLIQATNGNFYGTTSGTVFKITPSGTLTTLHSFCSWNGCPDGDYPTGLVQAADGNFYGTTDAGGAIGDGTVFKITPSGTLTKLHDFHPADGVRPQELVQGTDGNFYGTTALGGANRYSCSLNSCGTIFRITPSGTLTTLHSFDGNDGEGPWGALMQATNGTFYGTTGWGGPTAPARFSACAWGWAGSPKNCPTTATWERPSTSWARI